MLSDVTYFATQAQALIHVEAQMRARGYDIEWPDRLWAEHVAYGTTVKYDFPLTVTRTGGRAKKWCHIQLYRMGNGTYELGYYAS